ncbi:MAG: hypothetical protein ACFFDW_06125 [Candidatus Thorarchaeota archaeon]
MKPIRVKPIEIIGECPLTISFCDEFYVEGTEIRNPRNSTLCLLSITHLYEGIWAIQGNQALIMHCSCPGCIKDLNKENRVSFMLGFEENWIVGEIINKYNKLLKKYKEPEDAKKLRLKAEAFLIGEKKDLEKALQGLKTALKMYKKCSGFVSDTDYI